MNTVVRLVLFVVSTLFDALLIWWLTPDTGLNYHPTYSQAFMLSVLITSTVGTPIALRRPAVENI